MKAPEKKESAISKDWMMEVISSASQMLKSPRQIMIILVCLMDIFESRSSLMVLVTITEDVIKVVDAADMIPERMAATSKPIPHSGNIVVSTEISEDPLWKSKSGKR